MSSEEQVRGRGGAAALVLAMVVACSAACGTGGIAGDELPPAAPPAPMGPDTASSPTSDANDVGTVVVHRLNAAEYDNTVRDLLGETRRFGETFPPDNGAESFTNVAHALTISPLLFEKYEAAARALGSTAIASSKIMICDGSTGPGETATRDCATKVLARFLPRAWRRPVATDEVERLVALVVAGEQAGLAFKDAMRGAFEAALLSPSFLFRVEIDPDPASRAPHRIDDWELASRLSYFLWSSMPDDALFAYAQTGRLSDPEVLELQVRRMLRDPRANALVEGFASQWLIHTLADAAPDKAAFPSFDEDLRASMRGETKAFVGSFLFGDASLADMLDAPFTYVDGRMAGHYGITGVAGSEFVRVALAPDSHRAGLLTHASFLTMTAIATRTSPVRRGAWVLAELLCAPPPPPPPGIPALEENKTVGTIRERMEQHRKDPVCASCHSMMDPIGFALENYDALGRWRTTDNGLPIDASGQLPGGEKVDGAADLATSIKNDPRFARCATRKFYTYALGRVPEPLDETRLASLTRRFVTGGHRTRELIMDIVFSDAFLMRRAGP